MLVRRRSRPGPDSTDQRCNSSDRDSRRNANRERDGRVLKRGRAIRILSTPCPPECIVFSRRVGSVVRAVRLENANRVLQMVSRLVLFIHRVAEDGASVGDHCLMRCGRAALSCQRVGTAKRRVSFGEMSQMAKNDRQLLLGSTSDVSLCATRRDARGVEEFQSVLRGDVHVITLMLIDDVPGHELRLRPRVLLDRRTEFVRGQRDQLGKRRPRVELIAECFCGDLTRASHGGRTAKTP